MKRTPIVLAVFALALAASAPAATTADITIEQGATWKKAFKTNTNLTGCTLDMEVRDVPGGTLFAAPTLTVTSATRGEFTASLTSAQTEALGFSGEAVYDIEATCSGTVHRLFDGTAELTRQVSVGEVAPGSWPTPATPPGALYLAISDYRADFFDPAQVPGAAEDMPGALKVYLIGDSHSADEDFRRPLLDRLRTHGDVVMLGPELYEGDNTIDTWAPVYRSTRDLPDPRHGAYNGRTVAQVQTALVSADLLAADVIVAITPGTNDIAAGSSASTIETALGALVTAIRAVTSAPIVFAESPPFVEELPGQADSQHTTREPVREALIAALPAWAAGQTNVTYLPVGYSDGDSEIDGIHLRERGRHRVAKVLADEINRRFPEREGVLWPQTLSYRAQDAYSTFFDTSARHWTSTSTAFELPNNERFVWGCDVKITDLQAAGVSTIISYGTYDVGNHAMLGHSNTGDLRFYLDGGGPELVVQPPTLLNTWHRIVVWGDPVNGLLAIFVDGQIRGYERDLTAWTIASGLQTRLGDNAHAAITGMIGYMNHVFAGHGASVPAWPTIRQQVEAWYWEGRPISGDLVYYEMDESTGTPYPNNGLSTTPLTTSSSPTQTAHATAGAKPWDEQQ